MDKLKSRKFIMAVVSAVLLVVVEGLGFNLPTEAIVGFVSIVLGYIFGQSVVDAKNGSK